MSFPLPADTAQVVRTLIAENDLAPDFTLPSTTFVNTSFSHLAEQTKLLIVFCPACYHGDDQLGTAMVLKRLQAHYSQLQAADVGVVAIAKELPFVTAQWAGDLKLTFPVLSDPNLEVSAQYVGTFDIGAYLLKAGVNPDLIGSITCRPGIVFVDNTRVIRAKYMATKDDGEVDIDFRNIKLDEIMQEAIRLQERVA